MSKRGKPTVTWNVTTVDLDLIEVALEAVILMLTFDPKSSEATVDQYRIRYRKVAQLRGSFEES